MAITRPGAIENRTARGRSTGEGRQARDFLIWRGMRVRAGEENPEAGVAVGDRAPPLGPLSRRRQRGIPPGQGDEKIAAGIRTRKKASKQTNAARVVGEDLTECC